MSIPWEYIIIILLPPDVMIILFLLVSLLLVNQKYFLLFLDFLRLFLFESGYPLDISYLHFHFPPHFQQHHPFLLQVTIHLEILFSHLEYISTLLIFLLTQFELSITDPHLDMFTLLQQCLVYLPNLMYFLIANFKVNILFPQSFRHVHILPVDPHLQYSSSPLLFP